MKEEKTMDLNDSSSISEKNINSLDDPIFPIRPVRPEPRIFEEADETLGGLYPKKINLLLKFLIWWEKKKETKRC